MHEVGRARLRRACYPRMAMSEWASFRTRRGEDGPTVYHDGGVTAT